MNTHVAGWQCLPATRMHGPHTQPAPAVASRTLKPAPQTDIISRPSSSSSSHHRQQPSHTHTATDTAIVHSSTQRHVSFNAYKCQRNASRTPSKFLSELELSLPPHPLSTSRSSRFEASPGSDRLVLLVAGAAGDSRPSVQWRILLGQPRSCCSSFAGCGRCGTDQHDPTGLGGLTGSRRSGAGSDRSETDTHQKGAHTTHAHKGVE